jgi:excisionase family DNA binding protein
MKTGKKEQECEPNPNQDEVRRTLAEEFKFEVYTIDQVAKVLDVSSATARRMVKEGRICAGNAGKNRKLVLKQDLIDFIIDNRVPSKNDPPNKSQPQLRMRVENGRAESPQQEQPKSQSVADELRKLHELRREGILTEEEFERLKTKLIES